MVALARVCSVLVRMRGLGRLWLRDVVGAVTLLSPVVS